jgi:hypothetical protein
MAWPRTRSQRSDKLWCRPAFGAGIDDLRASCQKIRQIFHNFVRAVLESVAPNQDLSEFKTQFKDEERIDTKATA